MCEFCWVHVAEGLIVVVVGASLLGLYAEWSRWRARAEQIAHIRSRLLGVFSGIGDIKDGFGLAYIDGQPFPEMSMSVSASQSRFSLLTAQLKSLQTLVDHGTGMLTAAQRTGLQEALDFAKGLHDFMDETSKRPEKLDYYHLQYGRFLGLKWLGLPSSPPWEMS